MEYTFGSARIPAKINIQNLLNLIGITTYQEIDTVKDKINETVCQNYMNMEYLIENFKKYITIFQQNEEGKIIGLVIFHIESEYIKIHNLCANVKGLGKILLDKIKELSNILKIKIALMPAPVTRLFEYYKDNGFIEEGLYMVYYPVEDNDILPENKTINSKGGKRKTLKSKGGKRKTLKSKGGKRKTISKKYITKSK
jgi:hypothetical protein